MAVGHDKQEQVRAERARAVGLFRYSLIREAADPKLSTKQRGRLVRDLAAREHVGPFGQPVRVARATIDRWIRDWRRGGFDALVPNPRRVSPRTPADVLDLAVALKKEVPARTAVQVAAILRALRVGAGRTHPATTLRAPGTQHPPRRHATQGVRPVRGRRAECALDR
jgi:putative transposase